MKTILLVVKSWLLVAILNSTALAQTPSEAVVGTWLNQEREAKIAIVKQGAEYLGRIVWLKEPNDAQGRPKTDEKNPDSQLRTRPVMGMTLMQHFTFDGQDTWENGTIYDGRSGKTYRCRMTLRGPNTLAVRGYIGAAWMGLGQTSTWTRAD
ncbi:DUF2147 domain-containing protein [Spirosoma harenae]